MTVVILIIAFLLACSQVSNSSLSVHPTVQQSMLSGSAEIFCTPPHSKDCSRFTWEGPALSTGSNPRIQIGGHLLIINNLTRDDEGQYFCVCGSMRSPAATIDILLLPDFTNLTRERELYQGEDRAVIVCDAFPGDPPQEETVWLYNNMPINSAEAGFERYSLILRNVQFSDAGNYTCGFHTIKGFLSGVINVTVVEPVGNFTFIEPLNDTVEIPYGNPLMLRCAVNSNHPSLDYRWLLPGGSRVENATLTLEADEVESGIYVCRVSSPNGAWRDATVNVTVRTPPIFSEKRRDRTALIKIMEETSFNWQERLEAPPTNGVRVQLTKVREDNSMEDVDFGQRLSIRTSEITIFFEISPAQFQDEGTYIANFSNEYGFVELSTKLVIIPIEKEEVKVLVSGQNCSFLKNHTKELAKNIAQGYEICKVLCLDIPSARVRCTHTSHIVSLLLPKDYVDSKIKIIHFDIENVIFSGVICHDDCIIESTTPMLPEPHVSSTTVTVIVVVLVVIVALSLLVSVLSYTVFRYLKHKICKKDYVEGHSIEDIPARLGEDRVECCGYASVHHNQSVVQQPSVDSNGNAPEAETPITQPLMQSTPGGCIGTSSMIGTSSAKRPTRLIYKKSNSYHAGCAYSPRNRTPPDLRPYA